MVISTYFGLFITALGAATLLPLQSEAMLSGLIALDKRSVWTLVAVATAGNVLGSMINWWLGRGIARWHHKPWFPVSARQLARARQRYHRYGRWSLLLSWMPLLGDPLTVVAGVLREPFWSFGLLVLAAKLGRYLVLAGLTLGVLA